MAAGRPVRYLAGMTDKERLVQEIRGQHGVAANGLIAVLSTLEMAKSFDVYGKHADSAGTLVRRARKCLHYYFYFDDERFGQTQVRLATWFPFDCHVLLNGREWLARQMDDAGIEYARRDPPRRASWGSGTSRGLRSCCRSNRESTGRRNWIACCVACIRCTRSSSALRCRVTSRC